MAASNNDYTKYLKDISMFIDIETNHLNFFFYNLSKMQDGRRALPSADEILLSHGHMELLQMAYMEPGLSDTIHHIQVTNPHSIRDLNVHSQGHVEEFKMIRGQRTNVKKSRIQTQTHEGLYNYLTKKDIAGKGLSDRQVHYAMEVLGPREINRALITNNVIPVGDKYLNISDMSLGIFNQTDAQVQALLEGLNGNIEMKSMTQEAFYNKAEKQGLFNVLDNLMNDATAGKVKNIMTWNTDFDIPAMLVQLAKRDKKAYERFKGLYEAGKINFIGAEHDWQLLAFRLAKEDRNIMERLTININPIAFKETAGRIARAPNTFEEFQHAIFWKVEDVANLFSWHSKVKPFFNGKELHVAGADTRLEVALKAAFGDVMDEFKNSLTKGNHGDELKHGIDKVLRSDIGGQFLHQAFQNVMERETQKQGYSVSELTQQMLGLIDKRTSSIKKGFSSIYASKSGGFTPSMFGGGGGAGGGGGGFFHNAMNFMEHNRAATKIAQYSSLAGVFALLGAATYFGGGDKKQKLSSSSMSFNKTGISNEYKTYSSGNEADGASALTMVGRLGALGFTAGLSLWSVGFSAMLHDPNLLGAHKSKVIPTNLGEAMTMLGRTMLYGARKIEAAVPTFRLFRVSSMHEYMGRGSQRFIGDVDEATGQLSGKWKRFSTINGGRIRGLHDHGIAVDDLLASIQDTNPEVFDEISEILKPTRIPDKVKKNIIKISTQPNGAAVIWYQEFDEASNAINQSLNGDRMGRKFVLDVNLNISKLRTASAKNVNSFNRATGEFTRQVNPIVFGRVQESLVRSGASYKIPLDEYLKTARKSDFMKRNPTFQPIWKAIETVKWHLDMLPKGIGGGTNLLYKNMGKMTRDADTALLVQSYRGAKRWSKEGIHQMARHWGKAFREITINPMNQFLETPFEVLFVDNKFMGKTIDKLTKSHNPIYTMAGRALEFINAPHLGLPVYDMKGGIPRYFMDIGIKRILPAYAAYKAFDLANHMLGALTFDKGSGPLTGLPIAAYHKAQLAYSKISDILGLTRMAKRQEQAAPGSTGLGVLAPAISAATTVLFAQHLYKTGPSYIRRSFDKVGRDLLKSNIQVAPWLRQALRPEKFVGAVTKTGSQRAFNWLIQNPKTAAFGLLMAPMIPFLPGFLGSNKTYEERKAIINGNRDIEVRKNRGWILSPTPYQGGKVIQYRREALNLIQSDWQNKGVIYPSYGHRLLNSFTFGLFDRYMLEDYHAESQPVYKSSQYGQNIPLLGPLIAATIGRVIKPQKEYHKPGEGELGNPFERGIYQSLKAQGYDVYPQINEGNYYIDMVIRDGSKYAALEADGVSFHSGKKKIKDAKRQRELEQEGWSFLRVRSDNYFNDPSAEMQRVFDELDSRGIKPNFFGGGGIPDDKADQYYERAVAKNLRLAVDIQHNNSAIDSTPQLYEAMKRSDNLFGQNMIKMWDQGTEYSGFKGFMFRSLYQFAAGKKGIDSYVPRKADASAMYDPAQIMWGWRAGDITGIGGEFLRRVFTNPRSKWTINDLPNELFGVNWIPQREEDIWNSERSKQSIDYTHGTTFDKAPQGWLMTSRKGWEFLFPEVKGMDLEEYPDPVRLEILQQIAPYSSEFRNTSASVLQLAIGNNLSPAEEQRYYDTLTQVGELKKQIFAHSQEYTQSIATEDRSGVVDWADLETGEFGLEGDETTYRAAGVSNRVQDIRARLLQKFRYDDTSQLANDALEIQKSSMSAMASHLSPGKRIDMQVAAPESMPDMSKGLEAYVSGMQEDMWDEGSPFADTGNLASHNLAQDKIGSYNTFLAGYWENMTDKSTFWDRKLIPNRDYLTNYLDYQVFGKEVRLWQHPIEHLLKPMIANIGHRVFGIDTIPSFTAERREKQQYWDIIKYLKYKMLANQSSDAGDYQEAEFYHAKWRSTMIGADPTDNSLRDELTALPQNERAYFDFFANESSPEKRGKIFKFLPEASKRLYKGLWAKRLAEAGSERDREEFAEIQANEAFDLSDSDIRQYMHETDGTGITRGDWARSKIIQQYSNSHALPGTDWLGWSPDVDIEKVEVLALKDQGEQIEDYGFFDDHLVRAVYSPGAYQSAIDINSIHNTSATMTGEILPYIAQNDVIQSSHGAPVTSPNAMMHLEETTDEEDHRVRKRYDKYGGILLSQFQYLY
jgi:very-short-patch-repair endonuclease